MVGMVEGLHKFGLSDVFPHYGVMQPQERVQFRLIILFLGLSLTPPLKESQKPTEQYDFNSGGL